MIVFNRDHYISEANYPELVASLGKLMPSGEKFTLISDGEIPSQISNGVIYGGRMWVYSYSSRTLYGVNLAGKEPIKAIPVSSTSSYFADFFAPSNTKPLALSIVPHYSGGKAKLFLAQIIASGTDSNVSKEYSWADKFLVFAAEFSGEETSLKVEPPFKTIKKEAGTNSYYYAPRFDSSLYIPYVISRMVSGVEQYLCAIGDRYYSSGSSPPGALAWDEQSTEASVIYTSITTEDYYFKNQRLGYNSKNQGELVSVYGYSSSSSKYYTITSSPAALFNTGNRSTTPTITGRGAVGPLNVAGDTKVLTTFDVNSFPWASISETKVGTIKPNLSIPGTARVFIDAAAFLWGKSIFLIFVGTGIVFSRTLEAGSFGYLDTTSVLGTISQFGYLDYSQDEQSLYILGQDTSNKVKLAKITLNTNFDYATDGAWLPLIVSDGVPAYIKAKATK